MHDFRQSCSFRRCVPTEFELAEFGLVRKHLLLVKGHMRRSTIPKYAEQHLRGNLSAWGAPNQEAASDQSAAYGTSFAF